VKRLTGTGQGWALFVNPDTYPHRLRIRGKQRKHDPWELLYLRLDPKHDLLANRLAYRRVRGIYDDNTGKRTTRLGKNFARWAAREVMLARPDLNIVRVDFLRSHVTIPGRPIDEHKRTRLGRSHKRATLFPE
jgi:hypothetical protein